MNRNVNVITDSDGKQLVLINDIRFKGKRKEDWKEVETYLKEYVGKSYKIEKTLKRFLFRVTFRMNMQIRRTA